MDHFQARATGFWQEADNEEVVPLPATYSGADWEDLEEDPDVTEELLVLEDEPEDEVQPESVPLHLPSVVGMERLADLGMMRLAKLELRLREGQANDALHRIRMAIGLKSVAFRSKVRNANSQQKKTRAWKEIQALG